MILANVFFSFQGIRTSLETLLLLDIAMFLEGGMPAHNFSFRLDKVNQSDLCGGYKASPKSFVHLQCLLMFD